MIDLDSYYLAFSHCEGIGPYRFQLLIDYFGDVKSAYDASENTLTEVLGYKIAAKFITFRKSFDHEHKARALRDKGIRLIVIGSADYPEALSNISDPPICLYVKGDLNKVSLNEYFYFGIVGTRKPTPYGLQVAIQFASELAQAGAVIVSGLALGIDAAAHSAALKAGGKTIAFLGCGVDIKYPPYNAYLYDEIIAEGGLVISEFPPGMKVLPGLFVARNRLISGLSRGVMVIEGGDKSGSLITARTAAEQGKDVFAPPGPLNSTLSQAPNILLRDGAKLVTKSDDILKEYGLSQQLNAINTLELSTDEYLIYTIISRMPMSADEILAEGNLSVNSLLSLLSALEIKGAIQKNREGKYQTVTI